jgi:hypothetical protein
MSQKAELLKLLQRGRTITPVEALEQVGSFRLSERIAELEREGATIQRGWVADHGGARVRSYRLAR